MAEKRRVRVEHGLPHAQWECEEIDCRAGEDSNPKGRQKGYDHARVNGHRVTIISERMSWYVPDA